MTEKRSLLERQGTRRDRKKNESGKRQGTRRDKRDMKEGLKETGKK